MSVFIVEERFKSGASPEWWPTTFLSVFNRDVAELLMSKLKEMPYRDDYEYRVREYTPCD